MNTNVNDVQLTMTEGMLAELRAHLFPGDFDEHGAVLAVGLCRVDNSMRLIGHRLFCAEDGIDYVAGQRGYRMLRAEFIAECIDYCNERQLGYLAIHNHGGTDRVAFSQTDLASHERGYPALLDLLPDTPVGALVLSRNACAGDIWFGNGQRLELTRTRSVGLHPEILTPVPQASGIHNTDRFHRQLLFLGKAGQAHLASLKVAIVGLGGIGSLLVENLARLGVGELMLIDPDRIAPSNLSRIAGSTNWDARLPLLRSWWPSRWRKWMAKRAALKTSIASRLARRANPDIAIAAMPANFALNSVAMECRDCDFVFLAADSMQARLVFNAMVHQYLIPGIQMGSKIVVNPATNAVEEAFSVVRWVLPGFGCLWCNGLVSPHRLALEAKSEQEAAEQRYGADIPNPSVVTFNATAAALAQNEFLMSQLGLIEKGVEPDWRYISHVTRSETIDLPRHDTGCPECSDTGRFGLGDTKALPTVRK